LPEGDDGFSAETRCDCRLREIWLNQPMIPIHDLWWLAAGGTVGYGARYFRARIGSVLTTRLRSRLPDPTGELLRLQTLYGNNPYSLASIARGALVWSTPDIDGGVIYGEFGRVWLVAGDPLAPLEDMPELARQFAAFAKRKNRVVAFVAASAEFARLITPDDFTAVKVGASPYFDLKTWSPSGDCAKKLRAGVNQARRAGVEVEMISESIDESLKKEAAQLCMSWLSSRRAAATFSWLIALDPFVHSGYKKYFAARVDGMLVGFLAASPIPARKAWYLEDVLRQPDAPRGTATLLVVEALARLKAEGVSLATLGTSPLVTDGPDDVRNTEHPVVVRALRLASQRLGAFYNFDGLRRFKRKFVPSWWESEYALGQRGAVMPPRVAYAIVRALVPGGVLQLLTRQTARMIRGRRRASAIPGLPTHIFRLPK
jgi:phosphatidylglycerol lysyltransferase